MTQMLIAVDENGTAEWTRNRKLDGFFDGQGHMERVTDIRKVENASRYYIRWMLGPWAGRDHDHAMAAEYGVVPRTTSAVMVFASYEEAVSHEVEMLNAMRLKGVSFGTKGQGANGVETPRQEA